MADPLIAILREENANLRERLRQLQDALFLPGDIAIPAEWGLVNAERRIFAALTRRDVVTKEILWQALYGGRLDLDREPDLNCVESHMSRMRKKLRPFGVTVTSQRFVGYSLVDRHKYAATPTVTDMAVRHG